MMSLFLSNQMFANNFMPGHFSGILSGNGYISPNTVPDPRGGCPAVGFSDDLTVNSKVTVSNFWANRAQWYAPYPASEGYGTYDVLGFESTGVPNRIQVNFRNYHKSSVPGSQELSDYFWNFQVRIPANPPDELELVLELEDSFLFGGTPTTITNGWFEPFKIWHWFSADDPQARTLYAPFFRFVEWNTVTNQWVNPDPLGWRRMESLPVQFGDDNGTPRRIFKLDGITSLPLTAPNNVWRIQVATGLSYTIDQRDSFIDSISNHPNVTLLSISAANGLSIPTGVQKDSRVQRGFIISDSESQEKPTIYICAGEHFEPTGCYMVEGMVNYILDNQLFQDFNFIILPIANMDAFTWAITHVVPYKTKFIQNRYTINPTNYLNNGMEIHGEPSIPWGFIEYYRSRTILSQAMTLLGNNIDLCINIHGDLVPRPDGWIQDLGRNGPCVYWRVHTYPAGQFSFKDVVTATMQQPSITLPYMDKFIRNQPMIIPETTSYSGFTFGGETLKHMIGVETCPNLLYSDSLLLGNPEMVQIPVVDSNVTPNTTYYATKDHYYKNSDVDAVMNPDFHRDMGEFMLKRICEAWTTVY